jgi:predicted porin
MSDTGNPSSANDFWRQAWVGLTTPVGRVTLGRQYNVLFDLTSTTFAAYRYSPYIEQFKPELGVALGARQSNMVKYTLRTDNLLAELQVSAGEGTGDRTVGGIARYQMGEFAVGVGKLDSKDPAGKQVKALVLGGAYTSGPLYFNVAKAWNKFDAGFNPTLIVAYSTALVSPATPANQILSPIAFDVKDRDLFSTGFTYQLTPQFNIGAQYYLLRQTHRSVAGKSSADMFSVVGQYALSKRTDVYAEFDQISISGSSPTTFANGKRTRTGYMTGLRHRF